MKYELIGTNLTEHDGRVLLDCDTQHEVVRQAYKLLKAVVGFDLLRELTDLQTELTLGCGYPSVKKMELPLRLYNYILAKYNLSIEVAD